MYLCKIYREWICCIYGSTISVGLNDQINDAKNMMGSDRLNGSYKSDLSVGWRLVVGCVRCAFRNFFQGKKHL